MIPNINENFGQINKHKQAYLSTLVEVFPIINACSRFIFGPLIDYINFKYLYGILNITVIILSSTIYSFAENNILYFVYNVISAMCLGANFALFPTFISQKFGLK